MSSPLLFSSSDKVALSTLEITRLSSINTSLRSRTQFLEEIIFLLTVEIQRLTEIIGGDIAEFTRKKEEEGVKENSASYRSEVIKERIKNSYLELFKFHDRKEEYKLQIDNDQKQNNTVDKKDQQEISENNENNGLDDKNNDNFIREQEHQIIPNLNFNLNYDLNDQQEKNRFFNESNHSFKERTVHFPLLRDEQDDHHSHNYLKEEFRLIENTEYKRNQTKFPSTEKENQRNEEFIERIEEQEKSLEQARKRIEDLEREREGKVDAKDVQSFVEKMLNKEKGEKNLNETHIKVIVDTLISELNASYSTKDYHFQLNIRQLELELEETREEMTKTEKENKLMKQKLIEYSDFASEIEEIMEKGKKNDLKKMRLKELSEDFASKLASGKEKFNKISQKF